MPSPPRRPQSTSRATAARRRELAATERLRRRRALQRGRLLAFTALVGIAGAAAILILRVATPPAARSHHATATGDRRAPTAGSPKPPRARGAPPFAVGMTVLRLVDDKRSVSLPDGSRVPRTLVTYVRYPALGPASGRDDLGAAPAGGAGPFPMVVFGHGFAVTPTVYAQLLRAWVRAGYVVAAPVFPLGNANAPGGPNESDLPNQPADMSVVISRVLDLARAPSGPLSGLIATRKIAVAGHSDGGDSALAVAYDPSYRDPRVRAAMILSGAEIPGIAGFQIMPGGPAMLAVQGTADTINPPSATSAFYDGASAPRYRLDLLGASHLPPYSAQEPQLSVVERATTAFLDRYLKADQAAQPRLLRAGTVPGIATIHADP